MSTPYPKMVKAQLVDLLVQRDARISQLESRLAQLESDAAHRAHHRRAMAQRTDHGLRREAAKYLCEELGVRSVTTAQIDSYLAEVAGADEVPW